MSDKKPNDHHHDGGAAECRRLAERAIAALNDLANLDPRALEVASIVITDLRHLYPGEAARVKMPHDRVSAGPTDPPPSPKKP